MPRSLPTLMLILFAPATALAQKSPVFNEARAACITDAQKLCAGVPPGGGRIVACLKEHQGELSGECRSALGKAVQGVSGTDASATPAGAADSGKPAADLRPAPGSSGPPAKSGGANAAERYFVMKQVAMIDGSFHQGHGGAAYTLMVPTDWQFKGWVNSNAAEYGCFADWFAAAGVGKSADGSLELQLMPQYTFQYMDEPAAQQHVQQQNTLARQTGMKPCPLRAPMHAADFLRQEIIAKYAKGKTVVSVDAFPELDQIARHRWGSPPDRSATGTGGTRTEAARARLAYNDNGRPMEEWVSAAVVVHSMQSGRGSLYDWHAVLLMSLRTPKGHLDANDKLFTLIASTIHPDPAWQQYSNGVIIGLYRKKQEEEAKQSAIVAELQAYAISTINGVVANQQRGSYNSALGADQLIREVQTFRNPTTGATFELSNKYDHAWLNGANEYLMSDDPNFNPNGRLDGNWTSLQPVRPAP